MSEPIASVLGRIRSERVVADEGDSRLRQRWPEVYTGDGATVEFIVRTLRETPRLVLTYYYLLIWPWRVPIPEQALNVGIAGRDYWWQLELAEAVVNSGLAVVQELKRAA